MADPDRLTWTSGGGCQSLFGLPFFLIGLGVMALPLLGLEQKGGGDAPPVIFTTLFGGVFAAVGGGILFGRSSLELDRATGEVRRKVGLLFFPFSVTTHALGDYERVTFSREARRRGKTTVTVFPVRLLARAGEDLELTTPEDRVRARLEAERAAKFLRLGVEDRTVEPPSLREAGTLDVPLRERLRREPAPAPQAPPGGRAQLTSEGGRVVIEVPPVGIGPQQVVALGLMLVPLAALGMFILFPLLAGAPLGFVAVFAAFGLVFLLGALRGAVGVVHGALARSRIEVGSELVLVQRESPLRRTREELAADLIEEVELTGSNVPAQAQAWVGPTVELLILGDVETARIPLLLERAEQEWLRDVVRHALATGRAPGSA